jgi:N-acetylglucosamine kinase-like BadF-type ATPase
VQKGVNYSGIRIFNNLPQSTKDLSSDVNFKQALKTFLLLGSFYSLNEYYEWNMRDDLGSYK